MRATRIGRRAPLLRRQDRPVRGVGNKRSEDTVREPILVYVELFEEGGLLARQAGDLAHLDEFTCRPTAGGVALTWVRRSLAGLAIGVRQTC